MLLKVSDGDGGWHLFDGVEHAYLVGKERIITNMSELMKVAGEDTVNLIARGAFLKHQSLQVGTLEFVRNGNARKAVFTDIAYICNDRGDTLDKLRVNSQR